VERSQKGYPLAELQLINCTPWETGVVVLSYAANAGAETGTSLKKPRKAARRK
jgi:hypothetical protein